MSAKLAFVSIFKIQIIFDFKFNCIMVTRFVTVFEIVQYICLYAIFSKLEKYLKHLTFSIEKNDEDGHNKCKFYDNNDTFYKKI
ncbi:hypothetical protein BpHYR1_033761 [Brachionus plicatilis]|uniref:Uncharacterized protein n=1 Tax=Brachionus plicatilis TaxID=10195 RepID=A0A3M7T2K0_BRAPC|nr:hypothetical protein BpHYR1_033761 [Brachionus plicatilis]